MKLAVQLNLLWQGGGELAQQPALCLLEANTTFPRALSSPTDWCKCLPAKKGFDVKFAWLFRYGFLCRALCLKARYCELIMYVIWDLLFFGGMSAHLYVYLVR